MPEYSNYEWIKFYFREAMKEAEIIPSDCLRTFIEENMDCFTFDGAIELNNVPALMFQNITTGKKSAICANKINNSLILELTPAEKEPLLQGVDTNEKMHFFIQRSYCRKDSLNANYYVDEYFSLNNEMVEANVYQTPTPEELAETEKKYDLNFYSTDVNWNYNITSRACAQKVAYICVYIENGKICIKEKDASGETIDYAEIKIDSPGIDLYKEYRKYMQKKGYIQASTPKSRARG